MQSSNQWHVINHIKHDTSLVWEIKKVDGFVVSFQDLKSSESTGKLTVHRSCRGNIAFSEAAPDGSQVGIENNTSGIKGKVTHLFIIHSGSPTIWLGFCPVLIKRLLFKSVPTQVWEIYKFLYSISNFKFNRY